MATIASSTIGGGRQLQSASTIVAFTESGQHLLKIDGYSCSKDVPSGNSIRSRSFRVGGHNWHIRYYPNCIYSSYADYISILVQLDNNVAQGVKARYTFSLLDHVGKPVPAYTRSSSGVVTFSNTGLGFWAFITRDVLEKSEHLRDDCFTIRCDLTVIEEIQTKDVDVPTPQPPPVVAVPPSNLQQHLSGLLAARGGTDVTFVVDGKTFAAHRYVLAARSSVFREQLFGPTKESTAANVVCVDDMEAQDFEALLYFIYTDSLPEMKGEEQAVMLPDLIAAANRYKMERLRLICEDKLCKYVDVSTVAVILEFAEQHHCHGLKKACLEFLEHLSKSCPSILKDIITKRAAAL